MNKDTLVAYGYLAGWKIIGALPEPLVRAVFFRGAEWASDGGAGMPQLRKNLARVVGPENVTRELITASMRSYARYWLEAFRLPRIAGDERLMRQLDTSVVGVENLVRALDKGKGVVLVLPHTGNWDMAGMYLVNRFQKFTTVAERLKPEILFEAFVEFRNSLGFEVLAHQGGQTPPYERLREVVESGGIVCLLGERDLKATGVEVEFFGETTRMPTGAARLAIEAGAELLVVHTWFTEKQARGAFGWKKKLYGWGFSVSEPVKEKSVASAVQEIAKRMETNIKAHPEDWHMLQPLWLKDLDPTRYQQGTQS